MDKPTLAVWKFASCDGCQLTLLDCEDELLALAGKVTIAHFLEASSAVIPGPYDVSLVEGSITTPDDAERIRRIRERVAGPGRDRRVRDRRRDPGAAQLRRRRRVRVGGLRPARLHRDPRHLDSGLGARRGRLRAARLPDRSPPAARGTDRLPGRPQAGPAGHVGVHRVQAPRADLRDGRRRYAVPGPRHPRRVRRAVSGVQAGLFRVLRPDGEAQRGGARRAAAGDRDERGRRRPSLPYLQRGGGLVAISHRGRQLKVSSLARVEGEGALRVVVRDGVVERADLRIYEPPRFFEALLRGRKYTEPPDITARICGICPVAYQTSAMRRDRGRVRCAGRRADRASCGGCCTAASGSPAMRCTSTCCTRRTSSATRTRSRWRPITATWSSADWR